MKKLITTVDYPLLASKMKTVAALAAAAQVGRTLTEHIGARERWATMLGWCKAMLWAYEIHGWRRISRKNLRLLIRKLEHSGPWNGCSVVRIKKPNRQQTKFLQWGCEELGFGYRVD